jgi:hypothetical protein
MDCSYLCSFMSATTTSAPAIDDQLNSLYKLVIGMVVAVLSGLIAQLLSYISHNTQFGQLGQALAVLTPVAAEQQPTPRSPAVKATTAPASSQS